MLTKHNFKDIHFDIFVQKYIGKKYKNDILIHPDLMAHLEKSTNEVHDLSLSSQGCKFKKISTDLKSDKKFSNIASKLKKSKKRFTFFPVTQNAGYTEYIVNKQDVLSEYNFALHDSRNNSIDIFDTVIVKKFHNDLGKYRSQFKILFEMIYGPEVIINYRNNILTRFNNNYGRNICYVDFFYSSSEVLDSNAIQIFWFLELRLENQEANTTAIIEKVKKIDSESTCCLLNEYAKKIIKVLDNYYIHKGKIRRKSNFLGRIWKCSF